MERKGLTGEEALWNSRRLEAFPLIVRGLFPMQRTRLRSAATKGIDFFHQNPREQVHELFVGKWKVCGSVKHTKGMEAFMVIGVYGQWIYIDRNHNVAIVKLGSMPKSKDTYLDGYNLEGFYGMVRHLSKK